MTAALDERPVDHGIFTEVATETAAETTPETPRKGGILSWNSRFGAWVKAHPRLAIVLFIAL